MPMLEVCPLHPSRHEKEEAGQGGKSVYRVIARDGTTPWTLDAVDALS